MKNRYRIYIRGKHSGGKVWWIQDNQTKHRRSLQTKDKAEAKGLLDEENKPHHFAGYHAQIARVHLQVSDPKALTRTWQEVMDSIIRKKTGSTKDRWERAAKSKSFDTIRNLKVSNTKADDFERVLDGCNVSTNTYLRRLHNYALDMSWLLAPVIAKRAWPKVKYGDQRAITLEEHQQIVKCEKNLERRTYYELCWWVGGSQSDTANLKAENIDWTNRTICFDRKKTRQNSKMSFDGQLEQVLRSLPDSGNLFPYLSTVRESDRATEFKQRCTGLGITGVTLHSYRYSWAERARSAGFPERHAQTALGHGSKAVARAYAKHAEVNVPSLEAWENRMKPTVASDGPEGVSSLSA